MADLSRDEAVAELEDGQRRIDRLLQGLPAEDLIRPATIGGGDWSAKDLIGHVATWEEAAIDAVADIRRGEVPKIEQYFREGEAGVHRFNAETVPAKAELPLSEVRDRAAGAHETLIGQIRAMADDEWTARVPYDSERRRTLAGLLGSITGAPKRPFGHAFAHIPDLGAYVRPLS
jgi:hypothetical protein